MLERNTIISSTVLRLLKDSKHPISVTQILESLKKKKLTPNKTTIYRILTKLLDKKLITELSIKSDTKYYELTTHSHHHHHFICTKCESIHCLDSCILESQNINLNTLLPNESFHIESHDFNLYGLCNLCSEKGTQTTQNP